MSFYLDTRDAIKTTLESIDSKMIVVDYLTKPDDTSTESYLKIFGELQKTARLNGAVFTRRVPGKDLGVHSTGGGFELRFVESEWWIKVFEELRDPANAADPDFDPSEYAFQQKCDDIIRELYLHQDIRALMSDGTVIANISCTECWIDKLGDILVHAAEFTITIRQRVQRSV